MECTVAIINIVKSLNLRGFYRLVFADSAVKEGAKFNKRVLTSDFLARRFL